MIHTVIQMVRVVGLPDGPGFSVGYGLGGGGFWTRVCWINSLQKCYVVNYDFRCCNDWGF